MVVKIILKSHPEINFGFKIVNDKPKSSFVTRLERAMKIYIQKEEIKVKLLHTFKC